MTQNTSHPLVTVVTVVFNGVSYLEKTIVSVLDQKLKSLELVVIDGGSTDGTLLILEKYKDRIRWISEPDNGIYDAMNKGLGLAKGEWVNFLNGGDTYCDPDVLTNVFDQPDLAQLNLIYGDSVNVFGAERKYIYPRMLSRNSLRGSLGLCHQAVFVRRTVSPLYNLQYRYKAEYNWIIDIVYNIPEVTIRHISLPVVYYQLGGYSERGMLKNLKEFMQVTRKRFGTTQLIRNLPVYGIVFLRYIKYSITRPKAA